MVVLGIVCRLPMIRRPIAVPVLAELVIKDTTRRRGCGWPAVWRSCWPGALPGHDVHVVADCAYAGGDLKDLPPGPI